MSPKPWREIARPHKDVLEGTFKESEFAADILAWQSSSRADLRVVQRVITPSI